MPSLAQKPRPNELPQQIRRVANRLMDPHQAGHQREALPGPDEVQALADQTTGLLRTMEEKLQTQQ